MNLNNKIPSPYTVKAWFKRGINKWRLCFLVFATIYTMFLVFGVFEVCGLSYMSLLWDEMPHLTGGAFLYRGDISGYFRFSGFYPPMFDIIIASFFSVGGISVFTARLVSVVFSVLSLSVLFEFANRMYGARTALMGSVILGIMPGYFYLSRISMIESMLIFFFTVSALSFFFWLQEDKNMFLYLSGLALGLGFLTKYQVFLVAPIMLTSFMLLSRDKLKLRRVPLAALIATVVIVPWITVTLLMYGDGSFNQWIYSINVGNPHRTMYSTGIDRFPNIFSQLPEWLQLPIFYFFEMTLQYTDSHPISTVLYLLGLTGLVWFAWRRKPEDKYLLIWFIVVYVFFTAIPNKEWRYMMPVFPVLALTAANMVTSALEKALKVWKNPQVNLNKKIAVQTVAATLIVIVSVGVVYSVNDTYSFVYRKQVQIPVEVTTDYLAAQIEENESIMVMCPQDLFYGDMVCFYLITNHKNNNVLQYPEAPVDVFTPNFNITELVDLCKTWNVKYALICEHRGDIPYFNTTQTLHDVTEQIRLSGNFSELSDEVSFGASPHRIFVLTFMG